MRFVISIFFILSLVTTSRVCGQQLTGNVTDTTAVALPSAQVLLRQGEAILAFALTDGRGEFLLDLTNAGSSGVVEVRYFGYADWSRKLTEIDTTQPLQVSLQPQNIELREVVVAAGALPQTERGDTLIYRTEAYRDGSERKIEEVIAKLPGVEMDDNGNIKVKGKTLDRILVDGEDLFDKNYKLLSRNVPADLVNRIDVLTDYHQDDLVSDLSTAPETALNLHLDPTKKRPLFGEARLETGTQRSYAAETSLFHLGKRLKTVNFSDFNTRGHASGVGVQLLQRSQGLDGSSVQPPTPVLRSAAIRQYRLVREQDYLENTAGGTAQTLLYRISDRAKNRLIFNLSSEEYDLFDNRLRENIGPERVDSFRQRNAYDYRARGFWILNDFDVLLDDESRLDVRLSLNGARNDATVATLNERVGEGSTDSIRTELAGKPVGGLASVRYVRRLSPGAALKLSGNLRREVYDQQQYYRGEVYTRLPGSLAGNNLLQVFDQRRDQLQFAANLMQAAGAFTLDHTAGYDGQWSVTDPTLTSADPPAGLFRYGFREIYLRSSAYRKWKKVTATVSARMSAFRLPDESGAAESVAAASLLALQPSFNLEWRPNNRNTLTVYANDNRRAPTANQLVPVPYLADGAVLRIGLDTNYLIRTRAAGLRFAYDNKFDQYGFNFDLSYRATPNGPGSIVATDDFVITDRLAPGFASSFLTNRLAAHRYFSRLKTRVKVHISYDRIGDQLDIGSGAEEVLTENYTAGIRSTTRLGSTVTYSLRADYSVFTTNLANTRSTQSQLFLEQFLGFRAGKRLKGHARHHIYLPRLGAGAAAVHLLETEASLLSPGSKWEWSCGVRNLLNTGGVGERNIGVYQRFSRSYRLRPRTIYFSARRIF